MGKIKGWTKHVDKPHKEIWHHPNGGTVGLDSRNISAPDRYVGWTLTPKRWKIDELSFVETNKARARKRVIDWMKRNPNG